VSANLTALAYLVASVLFVLALRGLSSPTAARRGNLLGIAGMAIAVGTTLFNPEIVSYGWILAAIVVGGAIGTIIARQIQMTAMPQLVAGFHSLVGMAAVLVAAAAFLAPASFGILDASGAIRVASRIEMALGVVIGAITFSGSIVAFAKLQGLVSGDPVMFPAQHWLNLAIGVVIAGLIVAFTQDPDPQWFWIFTAFAFAIGVLLIIPIGGADMPVVISMLNSYSGWAAAGIGFTLGNSALIVTGALVGSSGAILSYIMCRAMNRSFVSVILGGFGATGDGAAKLKTDRPHKEGSAEDAAFLLKNAGSVIIVPGYGMAVAQAQHVLAEVSAKLKSQGVKVRYGIHPVAGRMPGHMNVLLAEANVPYDDVHELEEINPDFANTDVAIVIGANDVTNPAAKNDPKSPIFGMPILEVDKAKTVLFIKRSMKGVGYAGIDNELFYSQNTMMLLADAKKMMQDIGKEL
jgi:NAD(P) transhydrogenase subunit beta